MRPVYIATFIEKLIRVADGEAYSRVFPKWKSQLEMWDHKRLWWRGSGGGFVLYFREEDEEWTYLEKRIDLEKREYYRIEKSEYERLKALFDKGGKRGRRQSI